MTEEERLKNIQTIERLTAQMVARSRLDYTYEIEEGKDLQDLADELMICNVEHEDIVYIGYSPQGVPQALYKKWKPYVDDADEEDDES